MSDDFKLSATLRGHEEDVSRIQPVIVLLSMLYPLHLTVSPRLIRR